MEGVEIIQLPKIVDERGNLSFFQSSDHIPFKMKRNYWIYDVPGGEMRGSHAYKTNTEFVIALSGSFDVILDNGKEQETFCLNRSNYGLYVPNMIWRTLSNFSTNSLAFIAASEGYDENDYIRNYDEFKASTNCI